MSTASTSKPGAPPELVTSTRQVNGSPIDAVEPSGVVLSVVNRGNCGVTVAVVVGPSYWRRSGYPVGRLKYRVMSAVLVRAVPSIRFEGARVAR